MTSLSDGVSFISVLSVLISILSGGASADTEFDLGTLGVSSLKLLGAASVANGSCVEVTRPAVVPDSAVGRVLYADPIELLHPGILLPADFSTFFTFSISSPNPSSSAGGGLAFVISPDADYVGAAGGFLGVTDAASGPRGGVVAVEFDTLMDVAFEDINGNHVGLDLGSMVSAQARDLGDAGIELKSGDSVNSWIEYTGSTGSLRVFISYSNQKPESPILSAVVNLADHLTNDSAYVGFSASTQGSTEGHTIQWWSFKSSLSPNPAHSNPAGLNTPSPAPQAQIANPTPPHDEKKVLRSGTIAGVVTASAFFLAFFAFAFVWVYHKKFKGENTKSETLGSDVIKMPKEFTYKELKSATRGFDPNRVIGHGAFGTVYRGTLPPTSGRTATTVAVKRCSHTGQGKIEFISELSIIGTLRHRNLVRLHGWCHEKGEILLVYDMMRNGSLDKALFESSTVLPWAHRRKILLGVASALAYLHQECENLVIHRDVKTSNVMLDEGFNARLGDFGLARQIEHDKSPDATVAAGTMGYLAPEYLLTGRATDKTDVFSYGAVVLEVATGRRPIDKELKGGNLVDWVWGLHRDGNLVAAADRRLGGDFDGEEMGRVLMIGLACSSPDPEARPAMRAVAQMLLGDREVPVVPRVKPTTSFSTAQLLMTLQDSVSDLNGIVGLSATSSEISFGGGGGVGMDLV
ncbi:lectin protein kinase family protein [Striga asiatica]|uniref:non-specific serine/threonine protein kinase n=1 Tax=Striga asiatica TaxID=4170 RepID=A0A5A7QQ72_STRAF|nr:lectin protein kinase family protein [Striga asiatica]